VTPREEAINAALAELMDSNLRMLNRIAELERDDRLNKARIEDMQTVNGSYVEMTNHRIAELEAEVLRVRDYAERMDALAEHRLIAVNIGELKRAPLDRIAELEAEIVVLDQTIAALREQVRRGQP